MIRRLPSLPLALLALAVGSTSAPAAVVVHASVSNTTAGSVEHPRAVVVGEGLTTDPYPAAGATLSSVSLRLSDFVFVDSVNDQTCAASQVRSDETVCPVAAKVGQGTMDLANGEHLILSIYKSGGVNYTVLFTGSSPVAVRDVGSGSLASNTLTFGIPYWVATPNGAPMYVTAIDVQVGLPRPNSPGWIFTTGCGFSAWTPTIRVTGSDGIFLESSKGVGCLPGAWVVPNVSFSDATTGTPADPKGISAAVAFTSAPAWPWSSFHGQLDSLTLGFPAGITLGTSAATPSCPAAQVSADDAKCPAGSRVATGQLDEGGTIAVSAYNAPGGRSLNVLFLAPSRYVTTATLDASEKSLTVPIPAAIAHPAMGWVGLSSFKLTMGDASATSWLHTTGCPGTWNVVTQMNNAGWHEGSSADVLCLAAPNLKPEVPVDTGGVTTSPTTASPAPSPAATATPPVRGVVAAATLRVLARFLPSFATSARRQGKTLGLLHGLAGMDEVAAGSTVDIRCVRGCSRTQSFRLRKTLKPRARLLLEHPLPVTARTIVEIRVSRAGAIGRSARFVFKRVGALLLAHRITSGCVAAEAPFSPAACTPAS